MVATTMLVNSRSGLERTGTMDDPENGTRRRGRRGATRH
jgi:hypothetical protein